MRPSNRDHQAQVFSSLLEAATDADAGSERRRSGRKGVDRGAYPTFDVVLHRGEETKHVFFRWEPSERVWAGVIGTTVPIAGAEASHRQLNELADAAVADGWVIREDNRKER